MKMSSKSYYIVAVLDKAGFDAMRNLQEKIGIEPDVFSGNTHLTLAIYSDEIRGADLVEWASEIAQTQKCVDVHLCSIAIYLSGLVAIPAFTKELYELHYNVHQKYDELCYEYSKHAAGWLPHVTIAYNAGKIIDERMPDAVNAFCPLKARLVALEVSCVDNGVLTVLGKYPLQHT